MLTWLTRSRSLAWVDHAPWLLDHFHVLATLLDGYLPLHSPFIREAVRRLLPLGERSESSFPVSLEGPLGLLPAEEQLTVYRKLSDLERAQAGKEGEQREDLRGRVASAAFWLQTAWLRDGDPAPLVRALEEDHPFVTPVVVHLAWLERIVGFAPGLRKLLRRKEVTLFRHEDVALALGSQGLAQDGPRLLELLRRRPSSLFLAVAVIRTGDEASACEARRLWQPSSNLGSLLQVPQWLGMAREVQSPRLARTINRAIRRQVMEFLAHPEAAGLAGARDWLRRLNLLALPGPEGDAAGLAESMARLVRNAGYEPAPLEAALRNQPAVAELRRIGEQTRRLATEEESALEVLDWWLALRLACDEEQQVWLRDERFEQVLGRLALHGSSRVRDRALLVWLEQATVEALDLGQQWLAVLGEERAQVAEPVRRLLVERMLQCHPSTQSICQLESNLAWLETLPDEVQQEIVQANPTVFAYPFDADQTWLLALEGADQRRISAIANVCHALARANPTVLVYHLHLILVWIDPAVAVAFVRRFLPLIPVQELAKYLNWTNPNPSYRLQMLILEHLRTNRSPEEVQQARKLLDPNNHSERAEWVRQRLSDSPPLC